MDDQEMQFAPPEWRPPKQQNAVQGQEADNNPQPVYTPPPEQTQWQPPLTQAGETSSGPDYEMGYRAQQQQQSSNEQAFSQRRRRSPLLWIIGIIIVAMLFGGFMGQDGFFFELGFFRSFLLAVFLMGVIWWFISGARGRGRASFVQQKSVETRSFPVGMHPTIVIRDNFGTIRVHPVAGEGKEVIIQATKQSRGWTGNPNGIQVDYQQSGDGNTVTVKAVGGGWAFFGGNRVDFDISVPPLADLKLKTDAGNIHVDGVSGQMSLGSDAGNISAAQVMLSGQSSLKTDADTITFAGSIDPTGSYQFKTDVGSVNVTLPPDASFQVDAKTDIGSFHSDFPINRQGDVTGSKARGEVGNPPRAMLTLRTDVGSINLKKGQ